MPYADPEKRRITHNECCKRWRARSKKRYQAQQAVKYAIKTGKLVPWPGCAACKRKRNLHAHHCDYDSPLDVVWLCVKCHKAAHAIVGFVNTDPDRETYETVQQHGSDVGGLGSKHARSGKPKSGHACDKKSVLHDGRERIRGSSEKARSGQQASPC